MSERLHRQCPHCKSNKGFKLDYQIGGYGHEVYDFKGNAVSSEREGADSIENQVTCLDCGGFIDTHKVQTE